MDGVKIEAMKCPSCGAALPITRNFNGTVKCPSCDTFCTINGVFINDEIKSNINSGTALCASHSELNVLLVKLLASVEYMPLDVLEETVVLKEEHITVPAYLFNCSATMSYTYEAGNSRQRDRVVKEGDEITVMPESYTEWTHMCNTVGYSQSIFAPANRKYATILQKLYKDFNDSQLVDIEELEYPDDCVAEVNDTPQNSAFSTYVVPQINSALGKRANEALDSVKHRNLSLGASNIHKDETVRILLGIYRITYEYNAQKFELYVSADGKTTYFTDLPVDHERERIVKEKTDNYENIKKQYNHYRNLFILFIVLVPFTLGISLIGVFKNKKKKEAVKPLVDESKRELDDYIAQTDAAKQMFYSRNMPLKGIYSA